MHPHKQSLVHTVRNVLATQFEFPDTYQGFGDAHKFELGFVKWLREELAVCQQAAGTSAACAHLDFGAMLEEPVGKVETVLKVLQELGESRFARVAGSNAETAKLERQQRFGLYENCARLCTSDLELADPYDLHGWAGDGDGNSDVDDDEIVEVDSDTASPEPKRAKTGARAYLQGMRGRGAAPAAQPAANPVPAPAAKESRYDLVMKRVDRGKRNFIEHGGAAALAMSAYEQELRGRVLAIAEEVWFSVSNNELPITDQKDLLALAILEWDVRSLPQGLVTIGEASLIPYPASRENLPPSSQRAFGEMLWSVAGAFALVDEVHAKEVAAGVQAAFNQHFGGAGAAAAAVAGANQFVNPLPANAGGGVPAISKLHVLARVLASKTPAQLKRAAEKADQVRLLKWGPSLGQKFLSGVTDGIWRCAELRKQSPKWQLLTTAQEAHKEFATEFECAQKNNWAIECGDGSLVRDDAGRLQKQARQTGERVLPREIHCYRRMPAVNVCLPEEDITDPNDSSKKIKGVAHEWTEGYPDPVNKGKFIKRTFKSTGRELLEELLESMWYGNEESLNLLNHVIPERAWRGRSPVAATVREKSCPRRVLEIVTCPRGCGRGTTISSAELHVASIDLRCASRSSLVNSALGGCAGSRWVVLPDKSGAGKSSLCRLLSYWFEGLEATFFPSYLTEKDLFEPRLVTSDGAPHRAV